MLKRILHIISQYPDKTGSGIFLKSLVNEGEKKGYKQAVISASSCKMDKVEFKEGIKYYPVKFNTQKLNYNIVGMSDVMPYPSTKYSELTEEMYKSFRRYFENVIIEAIEEFNPDIILSHHIWIVTSIVASYKKNAKLIVFSQGTELRQAESLSFYKDEVIKGVNNIDLVCSLNDYQRNKIEETFNIKHNKIKTFGVGFSSESFYFNSSIKKSNDFVFIGKISKSKGVECLIRAFKKINTDSNLYIVGSGSDEEYMKSIASRDSRIIFTGHMRQENVADLLRKSKTFILPSFYEGLPLVILEALACGCKVIVSDILGISDWIGNKINSSGLINYIPLPRLNIDVPYEEDVEDFIDNIKVLMEKSLYENFKPKDIIHEVNSRSWEGYFSNLEKEFI